MHRTDAEFDRTVWRRQPGQRARPRVRTDEKRRLQHDAPVRERRGAAGPLPDGKTIPPTGERFAIGMATIGHWKDATMDHEWQFRDNQDFMNQRGLGAR